MVNDITGLKTESLENEKVKLSATMRRAQADALNFHSKLAEKIKEIMSLEYSLYEGRMTMRRQRTATTMKIKKRK